MSGLPANKTILILGDSITQDGRYISYINYYLSLYYPNETFNIISLGLGGETVSGLVDADNNPDGWKNVHQRLEQVLKTVKPGFVISCYGMNDGIYLPFSDNRFEAFKTGYQKLIDLVCAAVEKMVVITSPPFNYEPIRIQRTEQDTLSHRSENPYPNYDDVLTRYSDWLMSCEKENVFTIDLHQHLVDYAVTRKRENTTFTLSPDGIHPDALGHFLIAQYLLPQLGYPIPDLSHSVEVECTTVTSSDLFKLTYKKQLLTCGFWWDRAGYLKERPLEYPSGEQLEQEIVNVEKALKALT